MTHAEIINLWPTVAVFAADIGAQYETAKAMKRRSVIPARYWVRLVEKAEQRNFQPVNLEILANAAADFAIEAAE